MKEIYLVNPNDKGLVINLKREANIILSNIVPNSTEYDYNKDRFDDAITVAKAIESTNPSTGEEIESMLRIITELYSKGILSNLTLKDDEFEKEFNINGHKHNIRYPYIYKDKSTNNIYNTNAFKCYVNNYYSNDKGIQLMEQPKVIETNQRIYLSKGGIITGEYIEKCNIKQNVIDEHNFKVDTYTMSVFIIYDKNDFIYATDYRNPNIKLLQEIYDVPININNNIKNKKYSLRKYKKV